MPDQPLSSLDDVVISKELSRRPSRSPDYKAENEALHALARRMADRPETMLKALANMARVLCRAGSSGVSLLETAADGKDVFRWVALTGAYELYEGGCTPAAFSPCGTCLERQAPQLYCRPARYFTYLGTTEPPIVEGLVIPLPAGGQPRGTIWVVAHDDRRKFDAEDVRLMLSLAGFTAAALRTEETLKEADRRKDQFLATTAHELRNHLAPLRNALAILTATGQNASGREEVRGLAERQMLALVRVVDDLLDLARIRQGKVRLHKGRVDLAAVVSRAVETARPALDACGHCLVMALPARPLLVEGDAARLQQVLVNLLTNAAKYTEGAGNIRLEVRQEEGEAVVSVKDNGIGLAPGQLRGIFEMYAQLQEASSHSQDGLGIGLALVKSLVGLHGGSVEAFSDGPGKGSEFVVRLPTLPVPPPPTAPTPVERAPVGGRALRVLVVDDNEDSATSLALLLKMWGHQVNTAPDGLSALQVAQAFRPELVLLDVGLPGEDGREVGRRLRQQVGLEGVALVALTGFGQAEDYRLSKEAGFVEHLVKPVDLEALQKLLSRQGTPAFARRKEEG